MNDTPMTIQTPKQYSITVLRLSCFTGGLAILVTITTGWWFVVARQFVFSQSEFAREMRVVQMLQQDEERIATHLTDITEQAERWTQANKLRRLRSSPNLKDAEFLKWLNRQSEATGVVIRDFRPTTRDLKDGYAIRGTTVSAQGTYTAICLFLDQIRNCPQMIRVTGFEMMPRASDGDVVSMTLHGLLFTSQETSPPSNSSEG